MNIFAVFIFSLLLVIDLKVIQSIPKYDNVFRKNISLYHNQNTTKNLKNKIILKNNYSDHKSI